MIIIPLAAALLLAAPGADGATVHPPTDMAPKPMPVSSVLITKSERRLDLLDRHGNVIKAYRIVLGKNPEGHKQQEGDNRTPEGRYTIDARNARSDFFLSLRISYPARSDIARARKQGVSPGGDIFIHGMPNGKSWMWWKYNLKSDWTNGCIALKDSDMEEIWHLIADGTPIQINP